MVTGGRGEKSFRLRRQATYRQELYQYLDQVGFGGTIAESETEPKMDLCVFTMAGGLKDRTIFCDRGRPKAVRLINPVEQLITQAQLPCDVYLKHSHPANLTLHEFIEDGLLISEGSDTCGIIVEMEIYYAWPAPTS